MANQTLADAQWIWLPQSQPVLHQYVCFRRGFELQRPPRRTALRVSVDSDFILYVNGEEATRGQWSDWPTVKSVTTVDVAKWLRRGRNTLAILAYHNGGPFFCYCPGQPGLIAALDAGDASIVTDRQWKARQHPAFRNGECQKITPFVGYMAQFDARQDDDWIDGDYDDSRWPAAAELAGATAGYWRTLFDRPVPAVRLDPPVPVRVAAQGDFIRTRRDGTFAQQVAGDALIARYYWEVFANDVLRPSPAFVANPTTPGHLLNREGEPRLELRPPEAGRDGRYFIIDLGAETVGLLHLAVDAPAGAILDIAHGEHLDDGRVRAWNDNRHFADRYICKAGSQTFTLPFRRLGARYIEVHVHDYREPVKVGYVGMRPTEFPVARLGRFDAGDPMATRMTDLGTRTLELCIHEHFEDCPWREQSLYAYDSRNQALYGYYAFGHYDFVAASFDLLGRGEREDGLLPMTAPGLFHLTIPLFSLVWVIACAEHWLYSGRPTLFSAHADKMAGLFKLFLDRSDPATGLYRECSDKNHWNFVEWSEGLSGRPREDRPWLSAPFNLYLHEALGSYAWMLRQSGRGEEARGVERRRARLAPAIHKAFFNRKRRLYATYLVDGKPEHYAQLTQALAIFAGVAPAAARSALLANIEDPGLVPMTLSSLLYLVLGLTPRSAKARRLVSRVIAREWEPMTLLGATSYWETAKAGDDFFGNGSLCHGWSALPVYWHYACVLGVRPLDPGFARFVIQPYPDRFAQAHGTVPTPAGPVHIEWQRTPRGLEVKARGPRRLTPVFRAYPEAPIARATWNGRPARR